MTKRLSVTILLLLSLTGLVLGQKQKGRYLAEIPLYDRAEYKIEMEKEKSGIKSYSRIYQTEDTVDAVVGWYEEKLPEAAKSTGKRGRAGAKWTLFEFEPSGAQELPCLVKQHSTEFVGVRIEKNPLNGATDITLMEFLKPE